MITAEERSIPVQLHRCCFGHDQCSGHCHFIWSTAMAQHVGNGIWFGMSPLTFIILQCDASQGSYIPALGLSLGLTPICIIAFAHKGKNPTIYNNSGNYGKCNLKRREKEGLGSVQIVYAQNYQNYHYLEWDWVLVSSWFPNKAT